MFSNVRSDPLSILSHHSQNIQVKSSICCFCWQLSTSFTNATSMTFVNRQPATFIRVSILHHKQSNNEMVKCTFYLSFLCYGWNITQPFGFVVGSPMIVRCAHNFSAYIIYCAFVEIKWHYNLCLLSNHIPAACCLYCDQIWIFNFKLICTQDQI